jgi:CheY-like chemotaxis protein
VLRILVCSELDMRPELTGTLIGRQGIEVFRVQRFEDVRLLAATLAPQAILVDRDLTRAREFIEKLRQDPSTRQRSVAILARGDFETFELELLEAGANAILRLPPDQGWDERLARLLTVPGRHDARLMVRIEAATEPEAAAAILNLSAGGMLLATPLSLRVNDEIGFRFRLPDGTSIVGRGRIAREIAGTGYGVEFAALDLAARQAIGQFLRSSRLA